jgi:hypothetical protein
MTRSPFVQFLAFFLVFLPFAQAFELEGRGVTPGPNKFPLGTVKPKFELNTKAKGWKTYKVPKSTTPNTDDSPALIAALASGNYSANSTILFSKGYTYNIWTPLVFTNLNNVEVVFEGNVSLPTDVTYIQNTVAASVSLCCILFYELRTLIIFPFPDFLRPLVQI